MTTCEGAWGVPLDVAVDGEEMVQVQRCSGCPDHLVIWRGRGATVQAPGLLTAALAGLRDIMEQA